MYLCSLRTITLAVGILFRLHRLVEEERGVYDGLMVTCVSDTTSLASGTSTTDSDSGSATESVALPREHGDATITAWARVAKSGSIVP